VSSAGVPSSVVDGLVERVLKAADGPILVEVVRDRAEAVGREALADPALSFSRVRILNSLERLLGRGQAVRWRGATAETWKAPEAEKSEAEVLAERVTVVRDVLGPEVIVTWRVFLDRRPIGEFGQQNWAELFRKSVVETLLSDIQVQDRVSWGDDE
jgi:hypothetical protein